MYWRIATNGAKIEVNTCLFTLIIMGILMNSSCAVDFCFDSEHVIVLKETAQKAADDFLDKFFVRPRLTVVCTTVRQQGGIDMIC